MNRATDRISIAHVVWSLGVGGLERVVTDLVSRVDDARFTSTVYCLISGGEFADALGGRCPVFIMDKKPGRAYLLPLRLARSFRAQRIDIVHAHNSGPVLYGAAAARIARVPRSMCTLHGPDASERYDYRRVDRIRKLDRVVAVSEHVRAIALAGGIQDPGRVITIHNGIDQNHYSESAHASRDTMRRELRMAPDDRAIGVVARLTYEKDHATLLSAFALIAEDRPHAKLVVVGDGALRAALERQARDLGISSRTLFLGTRTDVAAVLGALDLFVLPSKIEGLGITLLEAMATGLPTIATTVGGIPEIVSAETTRMVTAGNVEEMAGAMRWVLDHPEHAAQMGIAGHMHVAARFGLRAMVSRYEALYEELAGQGRAG